LRTYFNNSTFKQSHFQRDITISEAIF